MNVLFNDLIIPREMASIDIEDRGYQFGDGVYEVIAIYNYQMFEWKAHYERLLRSAKEIELPLPAGIDALKENIMQLITDGDVENGYVYIQITRGIAPRMHAFPENAQSILTANVKSVIRDSDFIRKGFKAITTEDIRWLRVDIKSLNLLPNVMAKQKALSAGVDEAILVRDGIVTEASSSNVFAVKDQKIYTHPLNHLILNGITRQVVLRLVESLNMTVVEIPFTKQSLMEMDEVFITNTGVNVCPIIEIDGVMIGDGAPGTYTNLLIEAFNQLLFSHAYS